MDVSTTLVLQESPPTPTPRGRTSDPFPGTSEHPGVLRPRWNRRPDRDDPGPPLPPPPRHQDPVTKRGMTSSHPNDPEVPSRSPGQTCVLGVLSSSRTPWGPGYLCRNMGRLCRGVLGGPSLGVWDHKGVCHLHRVGQVQDWASVGSTDWDRPLYGRVDTTLTP